MSKKKVIIFCLILFVLLVLYLVLRIWPIVICNNVMSKTCTDTMVDDSVFNPLKNCYFSNGDYVCYLIKHDEYLKSIQVYKCNNTELLKEMKVAFEFRKTNSDVATVEDEFIVVKKDSIIFKTNIALDQNVVGLQNEMYGWIEAEQPESLKSVLSQFKLCQGIVYLIP